MDQTNKTFFAKGLYWPWGIVVFFVVLALADVLIVYYAFSRHPDRTTTNAYDDATRYESVVEELSRAKAWGLRAELSLLNIPAEEHKLSLHLEAAKSGDRISAHLRHAQYADADRVVEFNTSPDPEKFLASVDLPRPGNWQAEITVTRNNQRARLSVPVDKN